MRSWLVALRIARREARRAKGRTLLIVAMIAVPVSALSFAAASYDSYKLTPEESVTRQMGSADALMSWNSDESVIDPPGAKAVPAGANSAEPQPHTAAALLAHLPAGSRVSEFWESGGEFRTATGDGGILAYGVDTSDPMTDGLVRIDSGRAPRTDDEVLVSPAALARLGTHVGGTVTTVNPDPGEPDVFPLGRYTVVGVGEVRGDLQQYVVFRPSQLPDESTWLVKTPGPVTEAMYRSLGAIGIQVTSRELTLHPPSDLARVGTDGSTLDNPSVDGFSLFGIGTLISGLGLLEVVLLAGPAFAVGARRRQRDLALVATTGGTPSTLRRIVLADGIVGGIVAAVVGLAVGLAVAEVSRPILEAHLLHARFGAYRIAPLAVVAVIGLALLTGVLGALVPAFTASRQDVVAALSGRRGAVRSRAIWLVLGIAGILVGSLIAFAGAYRHGSTIVLAGLVIGEFGIVACTPTIIGIVARFGRFLPISPRIALRDTARRRSAAAPAVSAVMAAVAGSIALTVFLGASEHRGNGYKPALPIGSIYVVAGSDAGGTDGSPSRIAQISTILRNRLPGATTVTVTAIDPVTVEVMPIMPAAQSCPYDHEDSPLSTADQHRAAADPRCTHAAENLELSRFSTMVTTDPAVLSATLGLHGTQLDAAVAALTSGKAIVTDARYVAGGTLQLSVTPSNTDGTSGVEQTRSVPAVAIPTDLETTVVLPPPTAKSLDLVPVALGVVATPQQAPTTGQSDEILADLSDANNVPAYIETGPSHDSRTVPIILAAAAAVIALGAAAIATGLAAVDGRADLRILGAVGATPRVRRMLALSQSGVIAGLGSLLGAAAGFGAGAAVIFGLNQVYAGTWPAPVPYPIDVPWLNLGISVLVVPLIAMLGAGLLTRSRLAIERRAD